MEEKNIKNCACNEDNCNCKEIAESELRRKLDLLLRTGSILMESCLLYTSDAADEVSPV